MSESLKIKPLIVILLAGILLTSSTSMPFVNAQPTHTSLTIAVTSPPLGKPFSSECTIKATLKDESDNPLQNMDIDFFVACGDHTHLLGTVKTDSNGVASLTRPAPTWTNNVTATFSGTTNYASSSSEYIEFILIDYTPYLVSGGLIAVAIIGVVGYIVIRRRKKAITMPKTAKARARFDSVASCFLTHIISDKGLSVREPVH